MSALEKREFGPTGPEIAVLGFGAWGIGGGRWKGGSDTQAVKALEAFLMHGGNFIDTAHAYGNGHSEELISQALAIMGSRNTFVASKIPPLNRRWPATNDFRLKEVFPHDHVWRSTEQSLERMRVNSLFLQQFHVWTDSWAVDEYWMRVVDDLKRQRLIQHFGVSVDEFRPEECLQVMQHELIDAVQVMFNIFEQRPLNKVFAEAKRRGIAVIAREPLETGALTGLLGKTIEIKPDDWRADKFDKDAMAELQPRLSRVAAHAARLGITMTELALRFALTPSAVTTVIPGMRTVEHVNENIKIASLGGLPDEQFKALNDCRWDRE